MAATRNYMKERKLRPAQKGYSGLYYLWYSTGHWCIFKRLGAFSEFLELFHLKGTGEREPNLEGTVRERAHGPVPASREMSSYWCFPVRTAARRCRQNVTSVSVHGTFRWSHGAVQ